MNELDHFVVANKPRIPCTVRTLKPFWLASELKPWCHVSELLDAIQYLAVRAGMPDEAVRALKELHEELSSSLNAISDSRDQAPEVSGDGTNGQ